MKLTKEIEYDGFSVPTVLFETMTDEQKSVIHHGFRSFPSIPISEIPLADLRTLISELATGILEEAGHPVTRVPKAGDVIPVPSFKDPKDSGYWWFLK